MTLNDVLQECARNTYNTKVIVRGQSGYTGKGLEYVNRLLSGINYAKNMICRQRWAPPYRETVTLDAYSVFNTADLTHNCLRIREIAFNEYALPFDMDDMDDVMVSMGAIPNSAVEVTYEYLPPDLTLADLDVNLPFPDRVVDGKVLAQYADYQFLTEEGTDYDSARAGYWLGLFNDSFSAIIGQHKQRRVVNRG